MMPAMSDISTLVTVVGTIAGGVVGSLVTWSLTRRSERERWERDQATRWLDAKREVYAQHVARADSLMAGAPARDQEFALLLASLHTSLGQVQILGPAVAAAAGTYATAAIDASAVMRQGGDPGPAWRDAKVAYIRAARQDLGIADEEPA